MRGCLAQRIGRRDGNVDLAALDEPAKATKLNRISHDIVSLDLESAPRFGSGSTPFGNTTRPFSRTRSRN